MIVVADTTPLNYLILIDRIEILRQLYEEVIIPRAVVDEMLSQGTPIPVREWAGNTPGWIKIEQAPQEAEATMLEIEEGEREAILLAEKLRADLVLLDDLRARQIAHGRGLRIIGTLGVLADAARRGLIDFRSALSDLRRTNFRISEQLLDTILEELTEQEPNPNDP